MYYTGDHYYNGQLLIHGGRGNGNHGGAGTMYLAQVRRTAAVKCTLAVDNARLTSSERIAEVERLDLAGNVVSAISTSFTTYGGLRLSTTGPVYVRYDRYHRPVIYRPFYSIRSGAQHREQYYCSPQKQATIKIELPFLIFVDHVVVYPLCDM